MRLKTTEKRSVRRTFCLQGTWPAGEWHHAWWVRLEGDGLADWLVFFWVEIPKTSKNHGIVGESMVIEWWSGCKARAWLGINIKSTFEENILRRSCDWHGWVGSFGGFDPPLFQEKKAKRWLFNIFPKQQACNSRDALILLVSTCDLKSEI